MLRVPCSLDATMERDIILSPNGTLGDPSRHAGFESTSLRRRRLNCVPDKSCHFHKFGDVWEQLHCAGFRSESAEIDNKHRLRFFSYIKTEAALRSAVLRPDLFKVSEASQPVCEVHGNSQ